mmetsp:Transcript_22054/g.34675  ORF Transcript_22054/g.34675 Transcript_22054/m.34675 type:complete len:89 (+) Transcript_22054:63-329(+)
MMILTCVIILHPHFRHQHRKPSFDACPTTKPAGDMHTTGSAFFACIEISVPRPPALPQSNTAGEEDAPHPMGGGPRPPPRSLAPHIRA